MDHWMGVRGLGIKARLKTRLSCPKGPPPDAVRMSSKHVDPELVYNTQKDLQQQTPKMNISASAVSTMGVTSLWQHTAECVPGMTCSVLSTESPNAAVHSCHTLTGFQCA